MPSAPRIAMVGCGAIAEEFHLPALAADPEVRKGLVLVDPTPGRGDTLAARLGTGGGVAASVEEVVDRIDGAVVAAPHALHHALCRTLLEAGVPVLCEKPLTTKLEEAEALVELSATRGVALAVNQTRRLYPSHGRMRELLRQGALGSLRSVTCFEGEAFDWPAATGTYFGLASGGHGVILDRGAHQVDLLCWWLGEGELEECLHDGFGGSEATASLRIRFGDVSAEVHLSWLARFPNHCRIEGSDGWMESGIYDQDRFRRGRGGGAGREVRVGGGRTQGALASVLLQNFVGVAAGNAPPLIPAGDVLPSLRLLDACYREARAFEQPWMIPDGGEPPPGRGASPAGGGAVAPEGTEVTRG